MVTDLVRIAYVHFDHVEGRFCAHPVDEDEPSYYVDHKTDAEVWS